MKPQLWLLYSAWFGGQRPDYSGQKCQLYKLSICTWVNESLWSLDSGHFYRKKAQRESVKSYFYRSSTTFLVCRCTKGSKREPLGFYGMIQVTTGFERVFEKQRELLSHSLNTNVREMISRCNLLKQLSSCFHCTICIQATSKCSGNVLYSVTTTELEAFFK